MRNHFTLLILGLVLAFSTLAQNNIAPSATATAYGNQPPWNWQNINNQNTGTCGTQTAFVWTASPPSASAYMMWEWSYSHGINKIKIFHAQTTGRFLNGGMIQKWNGTSWVNHYQFSNLNQSNCENTITFPLMVSSKLRINAFQMGTGQNSNPNFREIEIYDYPVSGFDVSLASIDSPVVLAVGNNPVDVTILNAAADTIYWLDLGYQLDNNTPVIISNFYFPTPLAPGVSYKYSFSTPLVIPAAGTYTLKAWIGNANDSIPDNNPGNDTMTKTVCTGMAGTFTIGASTGYQTFNEAVTAVKTCGAAGPILFNVQPGTYNENIVLDEAIGMNATNTVTFRGTSKTGVILTSSANSVVDFNGGDYWQFKNMTVNASGYCAFWYHDKSTYNLVDSCLVNGNSSTTSSSYNVFLASSSATSYSGYGDNAWDNIISNNVISGGYTGICFNGISYNNVTYGNQFINNEIKNYYYYAIRTYYMGRTNVAFNKIVSTRNSSSYGIYSYYGQGDKINGNIINAGTYAIYNSMQNYYSTIPDSSFITNNMIYDFQNPTNQQGMYLYYNYNNHTMHNTIRVSGTNNDQNYPAIRFYYYQTGSTCKNNIIESTNASYLLNFYYTYNGVDIDNNLYIYPTTLGYDYFYCYYPEAKFKDFSTFQPYTFQYLSNHDANSLDNEDPHFASATDLHLSSTYPPIKFDNVGLMYDVDQDFRCKYETAIGADEPNFPVQPPNSGFISEDTVCFGSPITFVNVAGKNAKQGYWWYHDGVFKGTDRNYSYTFPAGQYADTIMLITENCGGQDTFSKIVVIDSPKAGPMADFVSDLNLVETAFPIQFYDISQNCPDSWEWSISPDSVNDPGFGMMPSVTYIPPTHAGHQNPWISFDYPGTFDVCLIAGNSKGADTICKQKYVVVKPSQWLCMYVFPSVSKSLFGILYDDGGPISDYQPNMNCDITLEPCASELTFEFSEFDVTSGDFFRAYEGTDNTGTKLWDETNYPSGMTGSITDPNFQTTFTSSTGKLFLEWASNASGQSSGFIGEWYGVKASFPAPTAMFTAPDTVCLGMPVTFENLSTGASLTYSWDMDEDGFFDAFDENPTYVYMFWPQTFKVKLTVENCGGSSTYTRNIVVIQPSAAPTADFTADSRKPVAGEDFVQFTDMSYGNTTNPYGCSNNWEWAIDPDTMLDPLGIWVKSHRFVAGTNMNSQNPIILFEDTGYYSISLTAGYDLNTDTETKVDYIYAIQYCDPTVTNLNPDIGISRVVLGTIDNTSGIGKDGYTNYANEASTFLDLQGSYTLTLERNSTYNSMNRKAWIDWNIDGDFDDAGEEVGSETEASTLSWDKTFTVPANAVEGATRMRVAASLGSTANNSCGNRAYGEIEDYRVIVRPDGTPPVITLDTTGGEIVYLEQCDCRTYVDAGATAMDNIDGAVSAYYLEDNIDCQNYGTYYYRYEAKDSKGNTATKDRIVVVNMEMIAPDISLLGLLIDTIAYMDPYNEAGWTANDTCSGLDRVDVMGKVDETVLGDYELIYTAYDLNGNTATASRMIYVRDLEDPQISLNGLSVMDIEVHNAFVDPWVMVNDNYPCAILDAIVTGGPVDIHTLGTYNLTYSITDCNGNGPVSVYRTVNVVDTTAPVIEIALPNYDGEVFTLEVFDYFKVPHMTETDNYKVDKVEKTGTFNTEFPTGQATKLGTYMYTYTVSDESGNSAFVEFTINVVDTEKPVIKLVGDQVVNLCRYDELAEDKYTIMDNYDVGLTLTTPNDGTYYSDYMVNKYWGFYTIIYNTEDLSGNKAAQVVRFVNVQECAWNGLEERGLGQYVDMYPNPTKGAFYVNVDLPQSENLVIRVSNMLGEQLEIITENNTYGGLFELDLGAYANGVYFVQLQTDEDRIISKVTLTR